MKQDKVYNSDKPYDSTVKFKKEYKSQSTVFLSLLENYTTEKEKFTAIVILLANNSNWLKKLSYISLPLQYGILQKDATLAKYINNLNDKVVISLIQEDIKNIKAFFPLSEKVLRYIFKQYPSEIEFLGLTNIMLPDKKGVYKYSSDSLIVVKDSYLRTNANGILFYTYLNDLRKLKPSQQEQPLIHFLARNPELIENATYLSTSVKTQLSAYNWSSVYNT